MITAEYLGEAGRDRDQDVAGATRLFFDQANRDVTIEVLDDANRIGKVEALVERGEVERVRLFEGGVAAQKARHLPCVRNDLGVLIDADSLEPVRAQKRREGAGAAPDVQDAPALRQCLSNREIQREQEHPLLDGEPQRAAGLLHATFDVCRHRSVIVNRGASPRRTRQRRRSRGPRAPLRSGGARLRRAMCANNPGGFAPPDPVALGPRVTESM